MKQSTLLIGGLAVAGILWYRHQNASAAPAQAAVGLDGIASFLFGGRKSTPSTESSVRTETRGWLARVGSGLNVETLASFYGMHAQRYWPYIDAELLAHRITPNYMQIAKWRALGRSQPSSPKPTPVPTSPGPRPRVTLLPR
jgi:hypothetical protein